MKLNYISHSIFMFFFLVACVSGQTDDIHSSKNIEQIASKNESISLNGFWDFSTPVMLHIDAFTSNCTGYMQYGDEGEKIKLEGQCHDTLVQLYEFDEFARVSGILEGSIGASNFNFTWSNHDRSLTYDFSGNLEMGKEKIIRVFKSKNEEEIDLLLLWPHRNRIYVIDGETDILLWKNYKCPHAPYACQYDSGQNISENLSISNRITSAGSRLYEFREELKVEDHTGYQFNYFYNYTYPISGDDKFDNFIKDLVYKYKNNFLSAIPELEEFEPGDRLKYRASGDFNFTMLSEEILSGYLTFNSSTQPRLETVAFTYDRIKKKFYRIQDIWEKDFDYLFYLKKNLENKKRTIVQSEEPLVRNILKEHPFSHYVVSAKGILFFTDYNFVYGRRHVLLPFDEISGFVKDKGLSNLINKKSKP